MMYDHISIRFRRGCSADVAARFYRPRRATLAQSAEIAVRSLGDASHF